VVKLGPGAATSAKPSASPAGAPKPVASASAPPTVVAAAKPVVPTPKDRGKAPAPGGLPPAPAPPAASRETAPTESLQQLADMATKGGAEKEKAWGTLTRKFFTASSDAEREEVKKVLGEVVGDLMFSKTPTSFSEVYEVQRGDNLSSIAKRHQSTLGFIRWANQKSSDRIVPGERLKIPSGKVKLIVLKGHFCLVALFNNNYVKEYPIAIGKSDKTPTGTFIIDDKAVKPDWYAPDGKVYKFGDEKNILGTRWIRFKETAQFHGYGIHGTAEKERDSIGKPASAGCIRMLNEDVEELFDVIPLGTEVVIRD
jgi:LysM repeat protein